MKKLIILIILILLPSVVGALEISSENPHFFEYNGKTIFLISSGDLNIPSITQLNEMAQYGLNHRSFTIGVGVYKENKLGNDWNPNYWGIISNAVKQADELGIIIGIVVSGNPMLKAGEERWENHIYNFCNGGPVPCDSYNPTYGTGCYCDERDTGKDNYYTFHNYDEFLIDRIYDDDWPWQKKNQFLQEKFVEKLVKSTWRNNVYINLSWELGLAGTTKEKISKWINHMKDLIHSIRPDLLITYAGTSGPNRWYNYGYMAPNSFFLNFFDFALWQNGPSVPEAAKKAGSIIWPANKPAVHTGQKTDRPILPDHPDQLKDVLCSMREMVIAGVQPAVQFWEMKEGGAKIIAYKYAKKLRQFISGVKTWYNEPGDEITEYSVPFPDNYAFSHCDCWCGNWVNRGCGKGGCLAGQLYLTRDCKSAKCSETRCMNYSACEGPSCSCGAWYNQGCGQGNCEDEELYQIRTCSPSGCDDESRCVFNEQCEIETTPDLNCDDKINVKDLGILMSYWWTNGSDYELDCTNNPDINKSGLIDINDFSLLFENWLK